MNTPVGVRVTWTGGTPPGTIKVLASDDGLNWFDKMWSRSHRAFLCRIAENEARLCLAPLPLRLLAHLGLWEPWW